MKLQLRSTNLGSTSLRKLALGLSGVLGYRVLRTRRINSRRKQLSYGNLIDKCNQYRWFTTNDIRCPEYTNSITDASDWITDGHVVFCRTLTRASEGRGIVVAETVDQLVPAAVYTKYMKKKREFRVHIYKDKLVRVVEKKKRAGWDGSRDTRIRNTANGYVFCRSVDNIPEGLVELALKAACVTASDFKGVDIGYNEHNDQLFVIEVNSAPGIDGSNVDDYVQMITSLEA